MYRQKCLVVKNRKVAPGHFVLKLRGPAIAKAARPGQFVQVLCSEAADPLLPRPFSFLTADDRDFSILYQVVGRGTGLLAGKKKGDEVWVVGPLGNGFGQGSRVKGEGKTKKILIGGGVGIPPLFHLAQQFIIKKLSPKNIHVFLGARNKSLLLCEKEFLQLGVNLHLATDDGSKGLKGFITGSLDKFLSLDPRPSTLDLYTCGPTPMLQAVSAIASKYQVPCEVSVEEPMACGFGACLGCAIEVRGKGEREKGKGNTRFAISCVEGPVFDSRDIVW